MKALGLTLLMLFSVASNANEQALSAYVAEYNADENRAIVLRNIRNHANLWSGWIDRIEDRNHTWGTFTALVDDGEVTFWHTEETDGWLPGDLDGAETAQLADTIVSAVLLSVVEGATEINPLGLPGAAIVKFTYNKWIEAQDFNMCIDKKRGSGRVGWAATGWNIGTLINPVVGIIAALAAYKSSEDLTNETIKRSCQGWIGPVAIEQIPSQNKEKEGVIISQNTFNDSIDSDDENLLAYDF